MPQKSAPAGFPNAPGCLLIGLSQLALLYLASLWLVPQLNPAFGLVVVIGLATLSGIYVFVTSLPRRPAASLAPSLPADVEALDSGVVVAAPSAAAAEATEAVEATEATDAAEAAEAAEATETSEAAEDDTHPAVDSEPALPAGLEPASRARVAWLRTVLREARQAQDLAAEGAYLSQLGSEYRHSNRPRRAIVFYQRALVIARQIGHQPVEIQALGDIAEAYADLGDNRQAIVYYEQHLALVQAIGDLRRVARTSWNLGLAYEALGNLGPAIAAMCICLNYERAVGHSDAARDAAVIAELESRLASETPQSTNPPPPPEK